jgi:hypothetical protein
LSKSISFTDLEFLRQLQQIKELSLHLQSSEIFAESMGIKLLNSSPYYAQANGQAEAFNKIIIKIIQKKIDQKPKRWHSVLNEALWAYQMAPHGATQTSPYELVYVHHAILPW